MSSLIAAKSADARKNPARSSESSSASQLVIGSGAYGRLPVMQKVEREAGGHKIKLLVLPTIDTVEVLKRDPKDTNAILHVTC